MFYSSYGNCSIFRYKNLLVITFEIGSVLQLFKWWLLNKKFIKFVKISIIPLAIVVESNKNFTANETPLYRIEKIRKIEKIVIPFVFTNYFKKKILWCSYDYPYRNNKIIETYLVDKIEISRSDGKISISFDKSELVGGILFIEFVISELRNELNAEYINIYGIQWKNTSLDTLLFYLEEIFISKNCDLSEKIKCDLHCNLTLEELITQFYYYEETAEFNDYWLNQILKNDPYHSFKLK